MFERDDLNDDDLYDEKKYKIHNFNDLDDNDLYDEKKYAIRDSNGSDDRDDDAIKSNDVHVHHVSVEDVVVAHSTLEFKEKK